MSDLQIPDLDASHRWVVEVTLATKHPVTDAALDKMADRADDNDGAVSARGQEPGLVFTYEVDSLDVSAVPSWALDIARDIAGYGVAMPIWLVDLRVCTPEVYEADALRPDFPELLASTDVAEVLHVTRQRVHQLHSEHPDFPAPVARLGSGPIWTRPAIEAFDQAWTRKAGRPAKAS